MLQDVPAGELAAVVTYLEMRARPKPSPIAVSPLRLARWSSPDPAHYRTLFARVGAPWLWGSRLAMDEAALSAIVGDPAVEIYAVLDSRAIEVGLLELDFRVAGECEIGFFGLIPYLTGKGHGRWLMTQATMIGWRAGIERLWLHTCTLDHPKALNFYRAQGFVPYKRAIETFPDPRTLGLLTADAAPQIPLL